MIQTIVRGIGGTVETLFERGAPTSCSVVLYTDGGSKRVNGESCSVDAVATTLSASATAKSTTVTVTSATGIITGRRYILGAVDSTEAYEHVTVKSLSGSTATTWAPILFDHTNGAQFRGLRVYYSASATAVPSTWTNGHAVFTPTDGSDPQTETVHCARSKFPDQLIDTNDIRGVYANADKFFSKIDFPAAFRAARNGVLRDLGGSVIVNTVLATEEFRVLGAYRMFLDRRIDAGPEWTAVFDEAQKEYERIIQKYKEQLPVDADQDGSTTGAADCWYTSVELKRA